MTRFGWQPVGGVRRLGGYASARRRPLVALALAVAVCLAAPVGALAAWEPAQPINEGADVGTAGPNGERSADVAVGANGLATALFFQADRNQAFFTRRSAGASSWSAPQGVPPVPGTTGIPNLSLLAANPAGDALGMWWFTGAAPRSQSARWPGDAAGPGAAVAVMDGSAPQVGVDNAGNGYAVVLSGQNDVVFARFDATTGMWSAPQPIAKGQAPAIAVNGEGEVAVAYTRAVDTGPLVVPFASETQVFVRRKPAGATGFSDEQRLDAPGGTAAEPAVAIDNHGAITAVFREDEGKPLLSRVFARRWLPGADPGDAELLSSPRPAYAPTQNPQVVVDPEGRVTAAWIQDDGAPLLRVYSAERTGDQGFGLPERVSPADEHFTDDESSEPPEGASPENERSVTSSSHPYDLAVDAEGTATIVYSDSQDGAGLSDADVKAARRATGGRWTAPVSLRSTAPGAGAVGATDRFRVVAGKAGQADAIFTQTIDGRKRLMATRFEGPPPPSGEHQTTVTSFDGTEILVQWCPAATKKLDAEGRAPTIIAGSGWGIPGKRCPPGNEPEETVDGVFGTTPIEAFIDAGYNVLTFDARGFWRSGGTVMVDSPDFEGRDAQALIDYVARQPEALLDSPGDPRLGMSGGSYGGGIQLVAAALDHRVDAIAPSIAWHSLVTSLFKRDAVKAGWASILVGAGAPTTSLPGVLSPAGIETGHMAPEIYDATATAAASGTIRPETKQWFAARGPDFLLDRIKAPTLLIQGTVDTLFTLDEAYRNFQALRAAGTEVKMIWFCGGHGACLTEAGDSEHIDRRVLAWFDRHLRGRDVSTGPEFEWIDEQGRWHAGDHSTLSPGGELRGTGSGVLPLTSGELPGAGGLILAGPSPVSVEVPIEVPPAGSTVLGEPQLRLTYSARGGSTIGAGTSSGAQQRTYVYAQLVDKARNIVVNNVATPIPIALDGEEHELSLPLERIASRSTSAGYSLQIVPQTSVYDGQRAAGDVSFRSIEVTLPVDRAGGPTPGGGILRAAEPRSAGSRTPRGDCLPRRLAVSTRRIGPAQLGRRLTSLTRRYRLLRRTRRAARFCVRGGGRFVVGLRRGRIDLIASTARGHRTRRAGPGSRVPRGGPPGSRSLARGLRVSRPSGSGRLIYGVRRGRVRFLASVTRRQARNPRALARQLQGLGFR